MACYPIINELLCYMVNFLDDDASNANALVKETVSNFFSNEEIAEAKKTLWRACNGKLDGNYITSSSENDNDVNDIILALEKLESENAVPEIVAKNLLCIPSSDELTLLTLQRKIYDIEKSQRNHAHILHKHTVEIENTSEKLKENTVKIEETNIKLEETNNTVNVYKTKLEIFEFSPTSDEPVRKAVKKTSKSAPASRSIFENGIDHDSTMPAEGGKNRQVVSLHIGQAGVQMGAACWELYCLEHGLRPDGTTDPYFSTPSSSDAFFAETQDGNHCARSIFMDLEPSVVDEIRVGAYKSLFHPEDLINHKEDAANNFARGHYTVGQAIIEQAMERIRRNAEACGGLQGFMMFHSFGGGTGSGFTSLLLDRLSAEFGKSNLLRYVVFPSPKLSTSVVEPINTVLHASSTMERDHCVFIFDNEATYKLCHHKLGIARPSYTHLNHHVAQVVSASTAALRFDGDLNVDMQDFRTNLVPLPRLHFPIMSYAPVIAKERATYAQPDACGITKLCFDPLGQMITCDLQNGKYMSCCLLYRGDIMPADVQRAIASIKVKRSVEFVSWCPSGFKIGINTQAPAVIPNGDLAKTTRAVTMLANTTATVHTWSRINHKFDLMFNKRAFIHWYMGEGLEEGEMLEARENLAVLERDYREVSGDGDDVFDGNEEY